MFAPGPYEAFQSSQVDEGKTLLDWLNNPWIVGIGGGTLSGLLVTFVSRKVLSRRDRGEYMQKLQSANREIIYALRLGIPERSVPERRVVESLISATARKYAVDRNDLHAPAQIGEELTKEIMDSSFISAKTKQEYYNQLDALIHVSPEPSQGDADVTGAGQGPRSDLAEYRSRMVTMMSLMLGVTTALMTMVLVLSDERDSSTTESITPLLPAIVVLFTTLMGASAMLLRKQSRRFVSKKEEGKGRTAKLPSSDAVTSTSRGEKKHSEARR